MKRGRNIIYGIKKFRNSFLIAKKTDRWLPFFAAKTFGVNFLNSYSIIPLKIFQPGGSEGDIENGGDLEESDVEYDENGESSGVRRSVRSRHNTHRGRNPSNRSGAARPDQYRYTQIRILVFLLEKKYYSNKIKNSLYQMTFSFIIFSLAFQITPLMATSATNLH